MGIATTAAVAASRGTPVDPEREIVLDGLRLDSQARTASLDGRLLGLAPVEFATLRVLAELPNIVFSRQFLLERVWGARWPGDERVVDPIVAALRQKLGGGAQGRLHEVRGVGFQLTAPGMLPAGPMDLRVRLELAADHMLWQVSPEVGNLLGWLPSELIGERQALLDDDLLAALIFGLSAEEAAEVTRVVRARTAGGGHRWMTLTLYAPAGRGASTLHTAELAPLADEFGGLDPASAAVANEMLASGADLALAVDDDNRITWASGAVSEHLGWRPRDLVGRLAWDLVEPHEVPEVMRDSRRLTEHHALGYLERVTMRRRDGSRTEVAVLAREVYDQTGAARGRIVGHRLVRAGAAA